MARAPIGRQQLLDAAREELIRGNGVLELAALTRRTGLSTGALYHHFGSKTGLLVAVYDRFYIALGELIGEVDLPVDAGWAARERERTRVFVAYHFTDPLALIVLQGVSSNARLAELEARYIQYMIDSAAANISRGQEAGEIPVGIDPYSAGAFVIGGLRHGIAQQLRISPQPHLDLATERLWQLTAGTLGLAT